MSKCKLCGGQLQLLGRLGNLLHYICRHCGMHFNKPAKDKRRGY